MRGSILFRIQRWLYFLLKGVGKAEKEHYLFILDKPLNDLELYQSLADFGWSPNTLGYTYKGQIYQCRKIKDRGIHQYHLRFYDDGKVTGHFELAPEIDVSDHLKGKDLRTMNKWESVMLRKTIKRGEYGR